MLMHMTPACGVLSMMVNEADTVHCVGQLPMLHRACDKCLLISPVASLLQGVSVLQNGSGSLKVAAYC